MFREGTQILKGEVKKSFISQKLHLVSFKSIKTPSTDGSIEELQGDEFEFNSFIFDTNSFKPSFLLKNAVSQMLK